MLRIQICEDDLSGAKIAHLLEEHRRSAAENTPAESRHALDLEGLRAPEITFWSGWSDGELAGCGALKELDLEHGEIKSMRTANAFLRQGVAGQMFHHIIREAERRAYRRLSLETGSAEVFIPARALYTRFGFEYCGPFGEYKEDPNSVFMTREL